MGPMQAALSLLAIALVAQAQGPVRTADKTGHVSNYDESKVKPYTLPDPLVMVNGTRVSDAKTWTNARRPEIIRLYEQEIFGAIPTGTPSIAWDAPQIERGETAVTRRIAGRIGAAPDAPRVNLKVTLPVNPKGAVPVILLMQFGGGASPVADPPVVSEILARGWGYATVGYQDIQ